MGEVLPQCCFSEKGRKVKERIIQRRRRGGKKSWRLGSGGRWASFFRVSLEPVSFWRELQPLAAHRELGKVLRDDKAFLSLASTPVWQRVLSFQGAMFGVETGGGPLDQGSLLPDVGLRRVTACGGHVACDFLTSWVGICPCGFSWLPRVRNAGHHSRGGMLRGPAVCPWDAEKQILWLLGRLLASAEPGREPGLSVLGEGWQGVGGKHAKPSLRVCSTPKLVVFEAVIYPNKERQWFCWPSQISEPCPLAGWLAWYLNWKHKGIPLKWSTRVGLLDALESSFGRWFPPTFVDNIIVVWSLLLSSCVSCNIQAKWLHSGISGTDFGQE